MENLESLDDGKMHKPIATKMTSKERSWGRHAQASRWERRREGKGGEWRAQRCSTRVQVHRAGRSTFAWRAKGTAWTFILTVERGCQVWEKRGGERPVLSAANIPLLPSSTYPCPFLSLAKPRKPRLPLSTLPSSPPLSIPRFSRRLRAPFRPWAALSSFMSGLRVYLDRWAPLSFVPRVARHEEGEEERERKGREKEGRVVNPRDLFQSSVSTIVVVFTDARFSEETSSIDASRRVRTDESWWLRTRLEWISKRIRVEWSSVLFMGCTTVNKVFGKSWDVEI